MDFIKVFGLAEEASQAFRRQDWEPGKLLYVDEDGYIRKPGGNFYYVGRDDLLSDNWELIPAPSSELKTMSFAEAFAHMKNGAVARRLSWRDPTFHLQIDRGAFSYCCNGLCAGSGLTVSTLEADDWVLDRSPCLCRRVISSSSSS